ncbi:MAG: hypothetical protein WBW53_05950 [Terriglobales bacterium]
MYSARTKSETEGRLNAALTLAVLSAIMLIAAWPAQARTETVLHNFTGGSDGGFPYAGLTPDDAGNFFGTTPFGGLRDRYDGQGIVFELSPNGNGGWNETVLYSFTGGRMGDPQLALSWSIAWATFTVLRPAAARMSTVSCSSSVVKEQRGPKGSSIASPAGRTVKILKPA